VEKRRKGARHATQGEGFPIRRLNRAEYENTVRDLLGVDIDLKDVLAVGHAGERVR